MFVLENLQIEWQTNVFDAAGTLCKYLENTLWYQISSLLSSLGVPFENIF